MHAIFTSLCKRLPAERRQRMETHIDSMIRELNYLYEKKDGNLGRALAGGWTLDVIEIIFILSTFNHYIIGPMHAGAMQFTDKSIGNIKSILHGKMSIDDNISKKIVEASNKFYNLISELSIPMKALYSSNARDIIYYIQQEDNEDANR